MAGPGVPLLESPPDRDPGGVRHEDCWDADPAIHAVASHLHEAAVGAAVQHIIDHDDGFRPGLLRRHHLGKRGGREMGGNHAG